MIKPCCRNCAHYVAKAVSGQAAMNARYVDRINFLTRKQRARSLKQDIFTEIQHRRCLWYCRIILLVQFALAVYA